MVHLDMYCTVVETGKVLRYIFVGAKQLEGPLGSLLVVTECHSHRFKCSSAVSRHYTSHPFLTLVFPQSMSSALSDIDGFPEEDGSEVDELTELGEQLVYAILLDEPLSSIRALIDAGAPLWYQNEAEGTSPLHAAAYMENEDILKLVLETGAIWNAGQRLHTWFMDLSPLHHLQSTISIIQQQTLLCL